MQLSSMLSHLLLLRPLAPHGARALAGKASTGSDWRPMPIHPMPPLEPKQLDGESSGSSSLCEMEAEWKYEIHADAPRQTYQESMKLMLLVRAFQQCGHFAAQVRAAGFLACPGGGESSQSCPPACIFPSFPQLSLQGGPAGCDAAALGGTLDPGPRILRI